MQHIRNEKVIGLRKRIVKKSSVRLILGILVVFSLTIAIAAGCFIYVTRYKPNVVASSASPDGQYELLFQQIGEPNWPFGHTHARLVLKDKSKTVAKHSFDVANDGGIIDAENWKVTWKENCVEAVISGEEQNDNQFILFFNGKTDSKLNPAAVLFVCGDNKTNKSGVVEESMKYKGTLIVVKDCKKALNFYSDVFGFQLIKDNEGNMELTDNLYLQESGYWEAFIGTKTIPNNNHSELYFEESDIEQFVNKLEKLYPEIEYVNRLMTHSWGQKVVRFYDLDGNLIEVGTPVKIS